jgi:transmembrane sensor
MSAREQSTWDQQRAWAMLAVVEDDPKVKEWLQEADSAEQANRKTSAMRSSIGTPTTRRFFWAAAAALLLTVAAVGTVAHHYFGAQRYETRIGEQRDILLPDGSKVTLNTNTVVAVRYSRAARRIELQRGEALFAVKHDGTRPFEVTAEQTVTRAVGTEFNVDLRQRGVTVSVLEGSVRVSAVTDTQGKAATAEEGAAGGLVQVAVAKGEALEFRAREHRLREEKADLKRIDAWRSRRLEFNDTALQDAVEEFNRYSTTPIKLGTPELQSVRVSGIFRTGDATGFLYSLQQALGVQTHQSANEIILTRPAP